MDEKLLKFKEKRAESEQELENAQAALKEAVKQGKRQVVVERHVVYCKELLAKAVAKNEELIKVASTSDEVENLTTEFELWLNEVTVNNDNVVASARKYTENLEAGNNDEAKSQSSAKKASVPQSNASQVSKTSSQRKKEQELAKLRREEIERQSASSLALAKKKHDAALRGKQMRLRQLEDEIREEEEMSRIVLEELNEENRRKIVEAKLKETELEDALSDASQDHGGIDLNDGPSNGVSRTREWVNNTEVNPVTSNLENQQLTPSVIALEEQPQSSNNTNGPHLNNDVFPGYAVDLNGCVTGHHTPFLANSMNLNPTNPAQPITSFGILQPSSQSMGFSNLDKLTTSIAQISMMNPYAQPFQPTPLTYTSASTVAAVTPIASIPAASSFSKATVRISSAAPTRGHSGVTFASTPGSTEVANMPQPSGSVRHPVTINELVGLLSRKDPLPEWKLSPYNGDPLQWHEWYGQFKSAIDSAPLTADVKLTYLKTLVTGKAKAAISEFAYCGAMYGDALRALERKFGQPQAVVSEQKN